MASVTDYSNPVTLSEGHIVSTSFAGPSGQQLSGTLDLDTVVGNVNGALSWGGSGFSSQAQNVSMTDGYTLTASLPDSNGNMVQSELLIGAGATTYNGQDAVQFGFVPPYSAAHATANNNSEADSAAHAQISQSDPQWVQIKTIQGDAAFYWPEGNAPAPGHSHAAKIIEHIVVHGIRCFG